MNDSEIKILVIVLATVVPAAIVAIVTTVLCRRSRQRRFLFLKRGITPIDDEEIESWRTDKTDEKTPLAEPTFSRSEDHQLDQGFQGHQRQQSSVSIRKPPSVIIYQNGQSRVSEELAAHTIKQKRSMDVPPTPVLARAPNSRPGLTDETVQGDDAFIPTLKRQPSRLAKLPPTASRQSRTRNSRSSTVSEVGHHDPWHGHYPDKHTLTRMSSDYLPRANRSLDMRRQKRVNSISTPPRLSFDDDFFLGGLSPRPLIRKSEIGRAIG
ncbi:hypothetical protein EDB81DRAFT_108097 [Dactylonectria macrodidyma]|uniref:Uncharacterized protein n=1 Tax=Dactylonectria macrodidyma TaxID=307937 RepID=A0A9P9EA49_9HYPO|nr:hypothetical protein EDB81DRAFT_108097 [Dactylonectria macrodidyma]